MKTSPIQELYSISQDEILSVKDYIRRKNTAVLTTMFTDIEGFTSITEEKGEQYSIDLRRHHDKIVVDSIEEGGVGLVIKFIGDAVMAVFSEPSAAVERSLLIQQRIQAFNQDNNEFDNLSVRIGLHMGQVAIEENIQADVFGRHVNRAARIESLAAGGQIYMSYSVFDSAKGWLESHKELIWTLHGAYYLKGIDKAVELYEVCDPAYRQPRPPAKGNRKRAFPKLVASIGLLLAGAAVTVAVVLYEKTEVWLIAVNSEGLFVDGTEPVVLDGVEGDEQRRLLLNLGAGSHMMHFDYNESLRYYAPFLVERGKNYIRPKFEEARLPIMSHRNGVKDQAQSHESRTQSYSYFVYDGEGQKLEQTTELSIVIDSARDATDPDLVHHRFQWKISRDGVVIKEGSVEDEHHITTSRSTRVDGVPVFEDEHYFFYYRYYMAREFAEFTLGARFPEYLDNTPE